MVQYPLVYAFGNLGTEREGLKFIKFRKGGTKVQSYEIKQPLIINIVNYIVHRVEFEYGYENR